MSDYLTTAEVADYLRLKERKVYELASDGRIPCVRVTGKWLFPRRLVDQWLMAHVEYAAPGVGAPPPVIAGSHDMLLGWAVRESGCELALLTSGSGEGLARLVEGRAVAAGIHLVDERGEYNVAALKAARAPSDVVLIEWARRTQGMVVANGNPHGLAGPADAVAKGLNIARRQDGAGAQALLHRLLAQDGTDIEAVRWATPPVGSETDLAGLVADGLADCGIGIEAAARRFRLGFVPLAVERFDIAVRRRDYFDPPIQTLLAFTRTAAFARRAAELGGYDIAGVGRVSYNP
ncbi:MAG: substrate-binding domain-containing protein [Actinomycetota bacterium]